MISFIEGFKKEFEFAHITVTDKEDERSIFGMLICREDEAYSAHIVLSNLSSSEGYFIKDLAIYNAYTNQFESITALYSPIILDKLTFQINKSMVQEATA